MFQILHLMYHPKLKKEAWKCYTIFFSFQRPIATQKEDGASFEGSQEGSKYQIYQ